MSTPTSKALALLSALALTAVTVAPTYAAGKGFCRNQARQLANQEAYMIGGTIIAAGKLQDILPSKPLTFPMQNLVNGAVFGLVYYEARRRWPQRPRLLAMSMALGEHVALYPLSYFVDRFHPRRGTQGIPPLLGNPRAFAQATWRHTIFGVVLGRLA